MSEKPQFERPPIKIFGKVPEEVKEAATIEIGRRFSDSVLRNFSEDQKKAIIESQEEKTTFELETIRAADEMLNELLEKYNLKPFSVPDKNIYILPRNVYRKIVGDSKAIHFAHQQLILADKEHLRQVLISSVKTIFHELTHMKGFVSFDMSKDGKLIKQRRVGLMSFEGYDKGEADEFYSSFEGLNEAIVQELTERNWQKIARKSENPQVQQELSWLSSEKALEMKKRIARKRPQKDESEAMQEIEWVDKNSYRLSSYKEQRRVLKYLVQEIASGEGLDSEEIIDRFFSAHFTGNMLELAHLIDKYFGEGTFRVVGMMTGEDGSASRMLDHLRKQRIRIKRENAKEN